MSTDCESVVSPSVGTESLQHSLSIPPNGIGEDRHAHSGISYEGRVSLISPLGNYESSMRAAFGLDNSSKSSSSSVHYYPPSFTSSQSQVPPSPNVLQSYSYSDDKRSPILLPKKSYSPSQGNNKVYDDFHLFPVSFSSQANLVHQTKTPIKRELVEISSSIYEPESSLSSPNDDGTHNGDSFPDNITQDENISGQWTRVKSPQGDSQTFSSLSKNLDNNPSDMNLEQEGSPLDENEEGNCNPISPYTFQESENGPSSVSSDQNETREIDPVTFMSVSYNGNFDMFNLHGENSKSLKCQFCSFSTDIQSEFSLHLNTHFVRKCVKCEHTTKTIDQLKEHMQIEHGIKLEDIDDIESTRVPQVNSQGKVKTFKCKQCKYIAVTKGEFWSHAKSHIKSEKLLSCNKCPFVTEYKHHLEYHMRNHLGSKPFKCNKCNYSCVNKSMLNSHLKSHSNIYQYRCSDCTYATKYCHSLKLHLRKYSHTPAMVLNPDGSPNPVPIIDVYGTRRGPKLKKDENGMPILPPQYQLQAHMVRAQMEVTGTIPPAPTVPLEKPNPGKPVQSSNHLPIVPPFPNPFSFNPPLQNYPSFIPNEYKPPSDSHGVNLIEPKSQNGANFESKEESLNTSKSPEVDECFACEICNFSTQNKDILAHHLLLHNTDRPEMERKDQSSSSQRKDVNFPLPNSSLPASFVNLKNAPLHQEHQKIHLPPFTSQLSSQNNIGDYVTRNLNPLLYSQLMSNQNFVHPAFELQQQLNRLLYQVSKEQTQISKSENLVNSPTARQWNAMQTESVLDLSKEQTPPNAVVSSSQNHSTSSPPFFPASPPNSDISTPPSKNRRKGRAFKLERIALRLSGSGEEGDTDNTEQSKDKNDPKKSPVPSKESAPQSVSMPTKETKEAHSLCSDSWGEAHQCQYCDIAFKDVVMYTMHMGYHGYKDPFRCNMCGFDASNKLAFFLHIGRSSHL